MKKMKVFALSVLLVFSLFCFSPAVEAHNPVWWDFDWNQRLEYTVNSTLISADLVDFPVLVYVDSDLVNWGDIQNNLDDIRFVGNYLDELSFEIDSFVLNDEAWFWVRLPEVSSSLDTYFFMYFDNKFCISGEDAEAVWDSNFVMVQHMNDATTSTILDSSSNDNDGAKLAANEPIETDGQIGKAQDFDGINDYVNLVDFFDGDVCRYVSAIITSDVTDVNQGIFGNVRDATTSGIFFRITDINRLRFYFYDTTDTIRSVEKTINLGVTNYVAGVYDGDYMRLYINGVEVSNVQIGSVTIKTNNEFSHNIGARWAGLTEFFNGFIDEVQVGASRSSAWVGASYETQRLNLLIVGGHAHPPDLTLRGEFLAAGMVLALILVPLLIFIIFAAKRRR